jgi:diacylglycerol kinase
MKRFGKSVRFAISGIAHLVKSQRSFRIQLCFAITVIILSIFAGLSTQESLWIVLCVFLVLILEAINTFVEELVDLIDRSTNSSARVVKDVAAAAVLLASVFAVLVGSVVFANAFFDLSFAYGLLFGIIITASLFLLGLLGGGYR